MNTVATPPAGSAARRWADANPAYYLLAAAMPFAFFPRLIDGDTQLWTLFACLLALTSTPTMWRATPLQIFLGFLAGFALLSFVSRTGFDAASVRFAYHLLLFVLLWAVVLRVPLWVLVLGAKLTLIVWVGAAFGQMLAIYLNIPIEMPGRYIPGRSGVPSLTPEPSVFGTISVLALIFLLSTVKRLNPIYVVAGVLAPFLSGSILSVLALSLVFFRLPIRWQVAAIVIAPPLLIIALATIDLPVIGRLEAVFGRGGGLDSVLRDASVNLRAGHIYFTLIESLPRSIVFMNSASFMSEYNDWAASTGIFIANGSNFVLSTLGQLVFGAGAFGFLIAVIIFVTAFRSAPSLPKKIYKLGVVVFCLLNPVPLSNLFFVAYLLRGERS